MRERFVHITAIFASSGGKGGWTTALLLRRQYELKQLIWTPARTTISGWVNVPPT